MQEPFDKDTCKGKLFKEICELIFSNHYTLFGGTIRDYKISKHKLYPYDIDIGVDDIKSAQKKLIERLKFCFDYESIKNKKKGKTVHIKLNIKYKFDKNIEFCIDISNKQVIGSNIDFDVNGVYMPDKYTYCIVESLSGLELTEIISNINKKRFKIISKYNRPVIKRNRSIKKNSEKLMEFIKMMQRVSKMLNRGWKLHDQVLEDVFNPCLIKELDESSLDEFDKDCGICSETFKKYELELNCCKKIICYTCAIKHIKSRFNNSEIPCPYCRGDPFGWLTTNNSINQNEDNDDNNEVIEEEIDSDEEFNYD